MFKYQRFVQTKFLGPTNYRSARVKAWNVTSKRSVTRPWDYDLDAGGNHEKVARELLAREEDPGTGTYYHGELMACGTADSKGYVFTTVES